MVASAAARMTAPSTGKKRKFEPNYPTANPIIFVSPGLKPDVRLLVFKQEFHVHSIILKLHSNYFRKFLDSPDKIDAPALALFRYEYVSVVDEEDHSWALDVAAKVPAGNEPKVSNFTNAECEIEAFRKLLCAMYNRPYTINTPDELVKMTSLADFYCALPILSATLVSGLLGSSMLGPAYDDLNPFADAASDLIHTAQKLRNPVFFRECFVHVVGQWQDLLTTPQKARLEENIDIFRLVTHEFSEVCKSILETDHHLIMALARHEIHLGTQIAILENRDYGMKNPKFYKAVQQILDLQMVEEGDDEEFESENITELECKLGIILNKELVLDKCGFGPGEGPYEQYLLCAHIADEDMPWDATQVDW